MEELDQILGENGAMEAFREAKETGIIKNIGITAHDDVRVLQKALELSNDIDTILLPVYVAAFVHLSPVNDFKKILEITRKKNIGVTAIKAISKSRWNGEASHNTWYKPLTSQELIDQAVWFTLSQEGVTTYSLPCDVRLWPSVLDAATRYKKLNEEDQKKVVSLAIENEYQPLFPE